MKRALFAVFLFSGALPTAIAVDTTTAAVKLVQILGPEAKTIPVATDFSWFGPAALQFSYGSKVKTVALPRLSNYLIPKTANCAVTLQRMHPGFLHMSNPWEERKSTQSLVTWFDNQGNITGTLSVNDRTQLKGTSDGCKTTVVVDAGYDPVELSEGGYVDPAWKHMEIPTTETLKKSPELRDSFMRTLNTSGHLINEQRTVDEFRTVLLSPNGRWVAYASPVYRSENMNYLILDLITSSSGTFQGNLMGGAILDDGGRLNGPPPHFYRPVWEPKFIEKQ